MKKYIAGFIILSGVLIYYCTSVIANIYYLTNILFVKDFKVKLEYNISNTTNGSEVYIPLLNLGYGIYDLGFSWVNGSIKSGFVYNGKIKYQIYYKNKEIDGGEITNYVYANINNNLINSMTFINIPIPYQGYTDNLAIKLTFMRSDPLLFEASKDIKLFVSKSAYL